jgi:hypothetical protein
MELFYMNLKIIILYISLISTFILLTSCSSSPSYNENASTFDKSPTSENSLISEIPYKGSISKVSINYTDDVERELKEIDGFDMIIFNQTLISALDAKGLFSANSDKTLEILIKNIEINRTSPTVQFDYTSTKNRIMGDITIKNEMQNVIGHYKISAEQADAQDSSSNGLYSQFANLVTGSLGSEVDETSIATNNTTNAEQEVTDKRDNPQSSFMQILTVIISLAAFAAGFSAGL